jgi:iron complex outermembrane recepter protein
MKKLIVITIVILFIFTSNELFSQLSFYGTLKGEVTDSKGNPLEYVNVTLRDMNLAVLTGESGDFVFLRVPDGNHLLDFKRNGYETKSININVTSGDTVLKVSLEESLIETGVIDVTSSFNAVDVSKSTFSITELAGRNLTRSRSQNLAETIQNIPGVNNISTGSGIGKPVIRGLSSQSVLIVHDGVKQESQQWGDEHGQEISLFDLERIEILRGPASLIYGSDGIGGVVNVISKPVELSYKNTPLFYGNAVFGGFSVDRQIFGNLTLGAGFKNFGIKGHFGYRKSGDITTPDGTFLVNTVDGEKIINGGKLFNSGSNEISGGVNFGTGGKYGIINFGFETISREIQIHEDPQEDSLATPNQKISSTQFSADGSFNLGNKLIIEPVLSYQFQSRKEFESAEDKSLNREALFLKLGTLDASVKLHHEIIKRLDGTIGVSFNHQKNETLAEEKLIPNYSAYVYGVYLLEKYSLDNFSFSAGVRFDSKKLNTEQTVFESDSNGLVTKEVLSQQINFNALSGSVGLVFSPIESVSIYANLGRGWRPPSEFELFVDGVHEGTGRYERGILTNNPNAAPRSESSLNLDAGLRLNYKKVNIQVSFFHNTVENFIYPAPAGDTIDGHPVFDIVQDRSNFYGYEYSLQYQPVKWLMVSLNGDFVHTKNTASNNPLPFTPPMKNIFEAKFQKSAIGKLLNPYIRLGAKIVSAQNSVDPLESTTRGYTLLSGGLGFDFEFAKSIASVDFSMDNIGDIKYTDHLSRYKGYALNPGRSFNIQITIPFRN